MADCKDPDTGAHRILGVGRLNKVRTSNKEAEVAALVADPYQNHGVGTELLRRCIQVAREEKLFRLVAELLRDNVAMGKLFKQFGFSFHTHGNAESITAVLQL